MFKLIQKIFQLFIRKNEIKIIETFIKELLESISPTCSAVAKLSAIKTNESYTLIVNISTMKISFKTRVTAKTRKETIRKFKIHLTKELKEIRQNYKKERYISLSFY